MPLARAAIEKGALSKDVVLFDVQVARDLMPDDLEVDFDSIGPVRMPYPEMFMEWTEPLLAKEEDYAALPQTGFLLQEQDNNVIHITPYYLFPYGPRLADFFLEYHLDDGGMLTIQDPGPEEDGGIVMSGERRGIEALVNFASDKSWNEFKSDVETIEPIIHGVCGLARVCFMALGLINCRNVKTGDLGGFTMRRSGSEKRRGIPPKEIRYSTILLPGGGSRSAGTGSGAHHRASAVHRVRGHFKTYTAEAPLMGKHVGTYWWGWQIRGSVESGVVESDYKLGA